MFFDIAAGKDPRSAQGRQPGFDDAVEVRIAPRAGAVINVYGFVRLALSGSGPGWPELDLAKRDAEVGMELAGNVNSGRTRQRLLALRFESNFRCNHRTGIRLRVGLTVGSLRTGGFVVAV